MERERDVERGLVRAVERRGGRAVKLSSPGNAGMPDRLVLMPGGRVCFVELKTRRGQLTALQQLQQDRLRELGFQVWTLCGAEDVRKFEEEVM